MVTKVNILNIYILTIYFGFDSLAFQVAKPDAWSGALEMIS
jgi:hypothetical protein